MLPRAFLAPEMNGSDNSESFRDAFRAIVGFFLIFTANAFAQEAAAPGVAEVERVIVTGSNIPTAEETGPNPAEISAGNSKNWVFAMHRTCKLSCRRKRAAPST